MVELGNGGARENNESSPEELSAKVQDSFEKRLAWMPGRPEDLIDWPKFNRLLDNSLRYAPHAKKFQTSVFDIDRVVGSSLLDSEVSKEVVRSLRNHLYLSLRDFGVIIEDGGKK